MLLPPTACPQCLLPNAEQLPFCVRCGFDLYYGRFKKPAKEACAYCQTVTEMTEEHLFPDWLRGVFPKRMGRASHILVRPERHAFWEGVPLHVGKARKDRSVELYTIKVAHVCAECNNEWMSNLQNQAKPIVLAFAKGGWPQLNDAERMTLARWSTMTAINFEYFARIVSSKQHQRTTLMSGGMPGGWRVALGKMADEKNAGYHFARALEGPIGIGADENLRFQSTLFCIERAAFYSISSLGNNTLQLAQYCAPTGTPDEFEDRHSLRRIWPENRATDAAANARLTLYDLQTIQATFGPVAV
ncbi:hypothetical protein ACVWYH_000862 [Bradyrhizobium sp. GM24.11]